MKLYIIIFLAAAGITSTIIWTNQASNLHAKHEKYIEVMEKYRAWSQPVLDHYLNNRQKPLIVNIAKGGDTLAYKYPLWAENDAFLSAVSPSKEQIKAIRDSLDAQLKAMK